MTKKRQNVGGAELALYFSANLCYIKRTVHLMFFSPYIGAFEGETGFSNE
jgi:hypothetical protein